MKSLPLSARHLCRGIIVTTLLTTGALMAGEDSSSSTTQGSGASKLQGADAATFIKEASQANAAEVALGDLAERKSQNADVKEFARMMKKDHSAANDQLRPIAQAHNVAMSEPLDMTHQKKMQQLQQLSGTEFDQQFMKDMLKGHQKVIGLFEKAAQQNQALDVKQYAQNTLPTLRQHLTHAKQTAQATGLDQQTISAILKGSDGMGSPGEGSSSESGGAIKPDSGTKPDQQERPANPNSPKL